MELVLWTSVVLCLCQSAIFSGPNLALFGLSRVQLEVEAQAGNTDARLGMTSEPQLRLL